MIQNIEKETILKIQLMNDVAILPTRTHPTDAGLDFYSPYDYTLYPFIPTLIYTGVGIALPENTVGLLLDRSSMGAKGIKVVGGVIDSDYRGEIIIGLVNITIATYNIEAGNKVAQLVIMPILTPEIEIVNAFEETIRGAKGYGSSGK